MVIYQSITEGSGLEDAARNDSQTLNHRICILSRHEFTEIN